MEEQRVERYRLRRQIPLYNIDGSRNRAGSIEEFARLRMKIGEHEEEVELLITDLGPEDVVLGLPWLRKVNPAIDWAKGVMKIEIEEEQEEEVQTEETERWEQIRGNRRQRRQWQKDGVLEHASDELWVAAGVTYAAELAFEESKRKEKKRSELPHP